MKIDPDRLRSEIYFRHIRSRGPGGQNVNKTSSAARLYWDFARSRILSDFQKERVRTKLSSLLNADGLLNLRSDESRDLERNKSRCVEKLLDYLTETFHVPKKRRATKPTFGSVRRRMESKTRRGETKRMRGKVRD